MCCSKGRCKKKHRSLQAQTGCTGGRAERNRSQQSSFSAALSADWEVLRASCLKMDDPFQHLEGASHYSSRSKNTTAASATSASSVADDRGDDDGTSSAYSYASTDLGRKSKSSTAAAANKAGQANGKHALDLHLDLDLNDLNLDDHDLEGGGAVASHKAPRARGVNEEDDDLASDYSYASTNGARAQQQAQAKAVADSIARVDEEDDDAAAGAAGSHTAGMRDGELVWTKEMEANLPPHSCAYCGIHNPSCVVKCLICKKW